MSATAKQPADLYADGTVTISGAVREFGIGRTILYVLMREGKIPFAKPRGRRLIPRAALRAYVSKTPKN